MKNTIFKPVKIAFAFISAFTMCLSFSTMIHAASVKNVPIKKVISGLSLARFS